MPSMIREPLLYFTFVVLE